MLFLVSLDSPSGGSMSILWCQSITWDRIEVNTGVRIIRKSICSIKYRIKLTNLNPWQI